MDKISKAKIVRNTEFDKNHNFNKITNGKF